MFLESGPLSDQKINAYCIGQYAKDFSAVSVGVSKCEAAVLFLGIMVSFWEGGRGGGGDNNIHFCITVYILLVALGS